MAYWVGATLSALVCRLFGRWKVSGREHIPATGGVLMCGNHTSYIDPPAMGSASTRPVRFMAKEPLFKVPVLGLAIRSVGAFPVRQHTADRAALKRAIELLNSGEVVGMFPEGTRNFNPGELMPPQPGVGMVVLASGAPVIPVALINTYKLLPPHSILPHFTRIKVIFGPPVPLDDLRDQHGREAVEEVGRRIMAAIAELLEQCEGGKA